MSTGNEFWNFLGSWFPDADLEGRNDEEVMKDFVSHGNHSLMALIATQLDQLLQQEHLPIKRIENEANRCFSSDNECRSWLQSIRRHL